MVSEPTASQKVELTDEEIFAGHVGGKLSVELTAPLDSQRDLSIAYTPGVAQVSRAPSHHIADRGGHRRIVEGTVQPHRHRNVVRRRRPLEFVKEPQPGLPERQRHPLRPHP
ncbi:hypothetical protein P3H15_55040, partial [Rhodococcus sp. T2V]|nr:hypothetical protein [Rhodococcus sp. T2V]